MSDKVTITTKHPALMPPLLGPHTTVTELEPGESRLITPVPAGVSVMVTAPLPPMLTVRADPEMVLDHGRGTFDLLLEDIGGEPRTVDRTETEGGDPEVTGHQDAGRLAARLHAAYGPARDWNELSATRQRRWTEVAEFVLHNLGPVADPGWRAGDMTVVTVHTDLEDEPASKLSMQVQEHFDQAAWGANLAGMEKDFLAQLSLMAGVVRQELESREATMTADLADLDRKHEQRKRASLDTEGERDDAETLTALEEAVDRARTLDKPTWLTRDGRPAAAIVSVSDCESVNGYMGTMEAPSIEVPR